jgi:hypothetical protein
VLVTSRFKVAWAPRVHTREYDVRVLVDLSALLGARTVVDVLGGAGAPRLARGVC